METKPLRSYSSSSQALMAASFSLSSFVSFISPFKSQTKATPPPSLILPSPSVSQSRRNDLAIESVAFAVCDFADSVRKERKSKAYLPTRSSEFQFTLTENLSLISTFTLSIMELCGTPSVIITSVMIALALEIGYERCLNSRVPGLMKIRYIGQATVGITTVFALFIGAGSLIHCGKSY